MISLVRKHVRAVWDSIVQNPFSPFTTVIPPEIGVLKTRI